jgi:hypothetical protein
MLLQELGDRKAKIKIVRNDDRVLDAEAQVGDRKILFSAVWMSGWRDSYWSVVFSEETYDAENDEWNGTTDATGSGGQFEVVSLITTCMRELLKKNPPEIRFYAKKGGADSARANIYRKLGDKLLPGYEREEDDDGREIQFRYTKSAKDIEV